MSSLRIIFIGTSSFAVPILNKLIDSPYQPRLVITAPDKSQGRKQTMTPSLVKKIALKCHLSLLQPEKILTIKNQIKNLEPSLLILAAYGQIIPKTILEIPRFGSLNIHPSLLPRWRGPSPVQFSLLYGDPQTGVSIILMDELMDHGPILATKKLSLKNTNYTYEELHQILAQLGAQLLLETLPHWLKSKITPQEQDHSQATYSKILKREDGHIDWTKSAIDIERQIRAFYPWPGSFSWWQKKDKQLRVKIIKTSLPSPYQEPSLVNEKIKLFSLLRRSSKKREYQIKPGQVSLTPQNQIVVTCGQGLPVGRQGYLILEKIQLEGKREMSPKELMKGHPDFRKAILK